MTMPSYRWGEDAVRASRRSYSDRVEVAVCTGTTRLPPYVQWALDCSADNLAILDDQFRFIAVNRHMAAKNSHLGSLIGKSITEVVHSPEALARLTACLKGYEFNSIIRDLSGRLGRLHVQRWLIKSGKPGGILARLSVVEGADQHALGGEYSARRLRLALDLADIFAYEVNFRTGVLTSNPPDPILNNMNIRSFADLLATYPEDVREAAGRRWESHLATGGTFDVEYVLEEDADQREWFHDTIEAVKDTQGDVIGLIGVKQNVTARKRTEATIRAEKEAARAADLAKSEFLANMSHEIRTPVILLS